MSSSRLKVMHTQSAAEYWPRSGSLVHTNTLATRDAAVPASVRIYAFGGTQHGPASKPPSRGIADNLLNPGDYRPFLRGLLDGLDAWVRDGAEPPASVYPTIGKGTLVDWSRKYTGFPSLPGVRYPEVIQRPPALDLGADFSMPKVLGHYTVKVPRCGPDGNDLGTLLPAEVAVPLATYTGWNLRRRDVGAEGMLASLSGSWLPFPQKRVGAEIDRRPTTFHRETLPRLRVLPEALVGLERPLDQGEVSAPGRRRSVGWGTGEDLAGRSRRQGPAREGKEALTSPYRPCPIQGIGRSRQGLPARRPWAGFFFRSTVADRGAVC